jgi:hypothetical protein
LQILLHQNEWNVEKQYARMKLSALFTGTWAEKIKAAAKNKTADNI